MSLSAAWKFLCEEPAPLEDLPVSRWKYPWSTHPEGARRIYNVVRWRKPRTLLETGTFEGLGTYTLAKACHHNGGGARIVTIDYDGDPDVSIPAEDWAELRSYRDENLEKARRDFPDVTIEFFNGDSRKILPQLLGSQLPSWDFFFQDSMHFTSGILAEWNLARPYSGSQAVVVFDDVCLDWKKLPAHLSGRKEFCLEFALGDGLYGGWSYRSTGLGRGQFLAQKKR